MSNNPLCHRKLLPDRVDAGWLKGHYAGKADMRKLAGLASLLGLCCCSTAQSDPRGGLLINRPSSGPLCNPRPVCGHVGEDCLPRGLQLSPLWG
jgi:hypothetical protein